MRLPNYIIDHGECERIHGLVIRDVGPWDMYPTVTNGVESVVAQLAAEDRLVKGLHLYYYDSEGELGEIVVEKGAEGWRFVRFAPGPR